MIRTVLLTCLLLSAGLYARAQKKAVKTAPDSLRYLAMGDSYTVGYAVDPAENFPNQLIGCLRASGGKWAAPALIAHNGWNTHDLLEGIRAGNVRGPFDLVTLMIGVNNQYRGYALPDYEADMLALVKKAIAFAGKKKEHVLVIAIPDWSLTPFASGKNPQQMSREVADFNSINARVSGKLGVTYLDFAAVYRQVSTDPTMTAADGLHPSAKMYALWTRQLLAIVPDFHR